MTIIPQTSPVSSWLWPFRKSTSSTEGDKSDSDDDRWQRERAFEIADSLECGMAREIATDFMQPMRRGNKLRKFQVARSEDKLQYRLFSDKGNFLMYAKTDIAARRVGFYLYGPSEKDNKLFNPERPSFTMTWNEDKTDWRLAQETCERCLFSPKQLTCSCLGKQQVAWIRHERKAVGDGIFNSMEIHIPGLYEDGCRVVWCPLLGRGDLSVPVDSSHESHRIVTRQPSWNDEVESLVLDFKGRDVMSSAKNFQLVLPQRPEHVLCQYGKIGQSTFGLDFKYPLSTIQAFGISLSTLFWT
eukprot:TRINITY_DN10716_c0_g1_i1.p1 TRINITY_DN10716_c0_g1~~TRINITY_DN10716_c0_g1_i1.p1  ORF type:complete len:300 (+),score=43.36 TRINITY_DN10716_c0_g1_i1:75-974(+)